MSAPKFEKTPERLAIEAEFLACAVNERVTVNQMAQAAHCTEARARQIATRVVRWVEKAHHLVFVAVVGVGYERVQHHGAFARSEGHRKSSVRKLDRALNALPAAVADGAPDELRARVADRVLGLATARQFSRQKKFTPKPRKLPALPDYARALEAMKK